MPNHPTLYQWNIRVWLSALAAEMQRPCTLDDIPDDVLDDLKELGFEWIYLLSVWSTGEMGRTISRTHPSWQVEFRETLQDLQEEDIGGSGFAIAGYQVSDELGGNEALARLRERMNARGMKLMLDFVPNHMGPDHPWVYAHPERFVTGTEMDISESPQNYIRLQTDKGEKIFAHGRDPYFDGWPDTVQLDYSHRDTVDAMMQELTTVASQCDGVRCDMAMIILPEVFNQTWGREAYSFWPEAIGRLKSMYPEFLFMAEVYWNMEWALMQKGFDYAYDKRLYDRLLAEQATGVRDHLRAEPAYSNRLVRFLENHDEQRAATAFGVAKQKAAAVISYLVPGLRFFHQGQMEGKTKKISPHLIRGPVEDINPVLHSFYSSLLRVLKLPLVSEGDWQLLEPLPAWEGNHSHESFILFQWTDRSGGRIVLAVNYSAHQGQCYVRLPGMSSGQWHLVDLLGPEVYERDGDEMSEKGLYLEMRGWGYGVYDLKKS
jgi:hypothetical protein